MERPYIGQPQLPQLDVVQRMDSLYLPHWNMQVSPTPKPLSEFAGKNGAGTSNTPSGVLSAVGPRFGFLEGYQIPEG